MFTSALLPLPVLLQFVVASAMPLFGKRKFLPYLVSVIFSFVTLCISIYLALLVYEHGQISYVMGGWSKVIGIEYKLTTPNSILLVVISGISFLSILYSWGYITALNSFKAKYILYNTIFHLLHAGLLGIVISNDLFNVYVFIEIASVASYVAISVGRGRKSSEAGLEYLFLGTIGATFYLLGIGLIYSIIGSLNYDLVFEGIRLSNHTLVIYGSFFFILIGLLIKVAVFPLHSWLCNSYQYSPTYFIIFFSGASAKASLYLLIKLIVLFNAEVDLMWIVQNLLFYASIVTIVFGAVSAVFQSNVPRMLAYSSISNIGYILFGISFLTPESLIFSMFQMMSHSLAKSSLFMTVSTIGYTHNGNINYLKGAFKKFPLEAFAFIVFAMTLTGLPLSFGFISKFLFLRFLILDHQWFGLFIILLNTIISIFYIFRVIEVMFMNDDKSKSEVEQKVVIPITMKIPVVIALLTALILPLFSGYILEFILKHPFFIFTGN